MPPIQMPTRINHLIDADPVPYILLDTHLSCQFGTADLGKAFEFNTLHHTTTQQESSQSKHQNPEQNSPLPNPNPAHENQTVSFTVPSVRLRSSTPRHNTNFRKNPSSERQEVLSTQSFIQSPSPHPHPHHLPQPAPHHSHPRSPSRSSPPQPLCRPNNLPSRDPGKALAISNRKHTKKLPTHQLLLRLLLPSISHPLPPPTAFLIPPSTLLSLPPCAPSPPPAPSAVPSATGRSAPLAAIRAGHVAIHAFGRGFGGIGPPGGTGTATPASVSHSSCEPIARILDTVEEAATGFLGRVERVAGTGGEG